MSIEASQCVSRLKMCVIIMPLQEIDREDKRLNVCVWLREHEWASMYACVVVQHEERWLDLH